MSSIRTCTKVTKRIKFNLENTTGVRISKQKCLEYESFCTKEELFDAMMTLKSRKTPGCDGLSILFYRKFWKLIVNPLYAMLLQAYEDNLLNPSGRRGVILLIPKKNKDSTLVKNWRPLTLLNYYYKIWAKAISNRLDISVHEVVGGQQCGFIKRRSLYTNITWTREIVSYLSKAGKPGVIAIVDFEKYFDVLSMKLFKVHSIIWGLEIIS